MFGKTLDNKPLIVDNNGNTIVDLAKSIFNYNAGSILNYDVVKMTKHYEMRPDLVSLYEYGTTDNTEYILKYSGISNPFSLKDDDILLIPNADEADAKTQGITDDLNKPTTNEAQIRNYFKFVNTDYKQDKSGYENVKNKEIPSGVKNPNDAANNYIVPYISEDGTASITIKNGRMYFGTDNSQSTIDVIKSATTSIDEKLQRIIDSTNTAMSDSNCIYNGVTLANFVRTTVLSNFANKNNIKTEYLQ